jgi:hypothetical protein
MGKMLTSKALSRLHSQYLLKKYKVFLYGYLACFNAEKSITVL